jgi:hypothetical protein
MVACGNGGSSEKEPAQSNWPDDAEGPAGTGGGVRVFGGAAGTLSAARSCTHEPGADGDRWCAFIGRSSEGDHNLFAVNVSQVKAGVPVACGSEDPNCLLLTDHVEGSSADFHPSFFQGDTLVYSRAATRSATSRTARRRREGWRSRVCRCPPSSQKARWWLPSSSQPASIGRKSHC